MIIVNVCLTKFCVYRWYIVFSAVCSPTCQNGGTCINPNTCRCPSTSSGPYCGSSKYFLYQMQAQRLVCYQNIPFSVIKARRFNIIVSRCVHTSHFLSVYLKTIILAMAWPRWWFQGFVILAVRQVAYLFNKKEKSQGSIACKRKITDCVFFKAAHRWL